MSYSGSASPMRKKSNFNRNSSYSKDRGGQRSKPTGDFLSRSSSSEGRSYGNSGERRSFDSSRSGGSRFSSSSSNGGSFSRSKPNRRSGNARENISVAQYTSSNAPKLDIKVPTYSGMPFAELDLDAKILANLHSKGYELTTEIQEKVIPEILKDRSILGISATGSGKTGAFLIPSISNLLLNPKLKLLVLAPTRELAQQISKEAVSLVIGTNLRVATVIGGESIDRQRFSISKGVQIVVGTPGRISDLVDRRMLNLAEYNTIVIDEVDRMLDMGFVDDVKDIISKCSTDAVSHFFSATLNRSVERIVSEISPSFEVIKLSNNTPSVNVVQSVIDYSHLDEKYELLEGILNKEEVSKAIIFVDTKRFADEVDGILYKKGFKVGVIHGDKRQSARKKIIDMFRTSRIQILVATNVAARGIDIDDITHVINLDEPQTYDEYIHRIGRTGRNGASGIAYTFVKRRATPQYSDRREGRGQSRGGFRGGSQSSSRRFR